MKGKQFGANRIVLREKAGDFLRAAQTVPQSAQLLCDGQTKQVFLALAIDVDRAAAVFRFL